MEEPDSTVLLLSSESGQMKRKALKCTLMFNTKEKKSLTAKEKMWNAIIFARMNKELLHISPHSLIVTVK